MESFTNFEKAPDLTKRGYRLDRMKLLLHCFDNPQNSYRIIHIAGSKGKGSTGSFSSSILIEAGYTTGVYSSPHISDYRERITVNGSYAREELYIKNMELIKELIEGDHYLSLPGSSEPTTFELLTLLSFLVFKDSRCAWVVLETGLGGRLDATNLVNPAVVILTPIELEHTDLLGNTLTEIAAEKAGIIKEGKPVFSSQQPAEALAVFRKNTRGKNAGFFYLPSLYKTLSIDMNRNKSSFHIEWTDDRENKSTLQMLGDYQGENCSLAIAAVRYTLPHITDSCINSGISRAYLPGRMEILEESPGFMIDGAHTKKSTEKLLKAFKSIFPGDGILIFGSVSGKDSGAMADILAPHFNHIIISRPGTFKKSDPQSLYDLFKEKNRNTYLIQDPVKAIEKARDLSKDLIPVLTTGSFYMVAEIRNILK